MTNTTNTVNIAVIGAGRIGRMHAEHLAYRVPGAVLVAVVDVVEAAAQACARACGGVPALQDYHAVLNDPAVDAIAICSATPTHAPIIVAAAAAHKHIFCEKPIALDLPEIDRALEAVRQTGVQLQVGFNRRFDANFARVRQAIVSGEIGEIHTLQITSRDPAPPPLAYIRESGGLFLDMTIHDFDMARFLIGEEVEEVYARGAVRVEPEIGAAGDIDTAVVMLHFAGGVIGTIHNSRRAVYGYDQRVEVFGSGGMITIGNDYANTAHISTGSSVARDLPRTFFLDRYTESYIAEMSAFVDSVRADRSPSVTGDDGRMAVILGMAAQESYIAHRPVRVPSR